MKFNEIGGLIRKSLKEHAPDILSVAAGVGTVVTAYLAGKASFEAARIIRDYEDSDLFEHYDNNKERLKERVGLVWKLYVPTAASAVATIGFITGANRVEAKKTIAAQTAFALSQRAYSEYRDKVVEELGSHKDQSIRDKIAEDRVKNNPPSQNVMVTSGGNVLCCELFTGRYFTSDMESLRRAQNDLNSRLLKHDYATLDDFYYLLGINRTTYSGEAGWKSDRMMELIFSTVLTDDGRPCLAFEYNYTTPL